MDNTREEDEREIRPNHYNLNPIPSVIMHLWGMRFHEGNILKYILRWRDKNGIEDLKKARTYLDELIKLNE